MPDDGQVKKSKMQEVIETLKETGSTEEEIQQVLEDVSKMVFARLNVEIMAAFSEEEIDQIEKDSGETPNEEEWEQKVKEMFIQKTGKNPDEMAIEYYEVFADGFLKEYENDKQKAIADLATVGENPPAQPVQG